MFTGQLPCWTPVCSLVLIHIYKDTAAIHQREDNEVRGAGGESFLLLLSWWETHDCDHYVAVYNDGYEEGCQKDTQSNDKGQHFNKSGVRTGEMNQGARSQKKWGRKEWHGSHRKMTGKPSQLNQWWQWSSKQSQPWPGGSKSSGSWRLCNDDACKWPHTDPETLLLWEGNLLLPEIKRQSLVWNKQERKLFICLKERWPTI